MKIFVLPGGSSPFSGQKYRRSYSDIVAAIGGACPEAAVELVRYPGQVNERGEEMGELRGDRAVEGVLDRLRRSEQTDVRLLCMCFGCVVGANVMRHGCTGVSRALFYGPLPWWKMATQDYLDGDPSWTDGSRGIKAGASITSGCRPFEDFSCWASSTRMKIVIGSNDKVVLPATLAYYRALTSERLQVAMFELPDAPHTVAADTLGWEGFVAHCVRWVVEK